MADVQDPILTAIDRVQAAHAHMNQTAEASPAELAAAAALDRAYGELIRTVPTTAAGMLALIELGERDGLDPEQVLELLAHGLRRMARA